MLTFYEGVAYGKLNQIELGLEKFNIFNSLPTKHLTIPENHYLLARAFFYRGCIFLQGNHFLKAIEDFTQSLEFWALAEEYNSNYWMKYQIQLLREQAKRKRKDI